MKTKPIHLENISQLLHNLPFVIFDFIFSHFHIAIGAEFIVSVTIDIREVEHFECVVPACSYIPRYHPFGQRFLAFGLTDSGHSIEDCKPFGENNGCRILDSVRGLP